MNKCTKMAFTDKPHFNEYLKAHDQEHKKHLRSKKLYKCPECSMLHMTSDTKVIQRGKRKRYESYIVYKIKYFLNLDDKEEN